MSSLGGFCFGFVPGKGARTLTLILSYTFELDDINEKDLLILIFIHDCSHIGISLVIGTGFHRMW